MELFPLHCEHSGCISRFHALMEEEKYKTEAAFYFDFVFWDFVFILNVMHQWICLNELCKLIEAFFKFQIRFRIIGRKNKIIQ